MYCSRMVPTVSASDHCIRLSLMLFVSSQLYRCLAHHSDLDHGGSGRRSHEHTQLLLNAFTAGHLWRQYGVISDIMVCQVTLLVI